MGRPVLSWGQDPGKVQCLGLGALCHKPLQVAVPSLSPRSMGRPDPSATLCLSTASRTALRTPGAHPPSRNLPEALSWCAPPWPCRPAPAAQLLRKVTMSQSCRASVLLVTPLDNAEGSPGSSPGRRVNPSPVRTDPRPLKPKSEESWGKRQTETRRDTVTEPVKRREREAEKGDVRAFPCTAPPHQAGLVAGQGVPTPPIPLPHPRSR